MSYAFAIDFDLMFNLTIFYVFVKSHANQACINLIKNTGKKRILRNIITI